MNRVDLIILTYCIICWCGMLFVASWRIAKEKRNGNDVDLWCDEGPQPSMPMIFMAPVAVPILVVFGAGWIIGKIPHIIAAGFADIQERIEKK